MNRWIYTLTKGIALRNLIHAEDSDNEAIMKMIAACYLEIGENYPIYDKTSRDDFQEEMDDYAREIYSDIEESKNEGYIDDETVDYHLNNLYDFCDNMNVWVKI